MSTSAITPSDPLLVTAHLPGIGGTIGPEPEDFQVDETPLYAASGEGEHLYVRVRKRRLTTRDAVMTIAAAAGVPSQEIGTAGMKDKHAVTTQWMSLPARRAKPVAEWQLPEGVSVLESTRHGNKLRTGHLLGNHFRIRLVGVEEGAIGAAKRIVEVLRERGLPNYFGAQRFGHGGRNLGDALGWLGASGERRRLKPFERKLFASVVQSEVFNRYTTARLAERLDAPLEGEVVRLHGSGAVFVVDDVARETSRWASRDIHPTGPMIGPKMRAARGPALALEEAAVAAVGLGDEARKELARHADGTRRDLLVHLDEVTLRSSDEQDREENPSAAGGNAAPPALVVEFFLPSGSYATQLVRELTREPFFRYTA